MWTLECDDPALDNRRIWLRPGKRYLLGRTSDTNPWKKDDWMSHWKSVSRKHVTLVVSTVKPDSGVSVASHVNDRSEITIKDENTKLGTEIDGMKVEAGTERIFNGDEHTFRLGKIEHYFRVKWEPVVLTFSFSSKETKGGRDPLADIRKQLEQLDIKTIIPYLPGTTTHVVQNKRNTAKGLQALINAKYIVTNSFTDALIEATTPTNLNEDESMSLLEEDYDKHWPNALNFLPAKSKEPNERPAEFFAPNPARQAVFDGYSFIFCDQVQFETLLPPITNGGGKAFKFPLQPGRTTSGEIVRFVKEHAGEKGLGEFEDASTGKGVVVVRFRGGSDQHQQWALDLGNQVALALGQRLIEQSEFMDAILTNDAKILRKPLQVEDEQASMNSVNRQSVEMQSAQGTLKADISQASKPSRSRGPVQRRFKGFDADDEDDTVLPEPSRISSNESYKANRSNAVRSQRDAVRDIDDESQMDIEEPDPAVGNIQNENSRKRSAPPSDEEGEQQMIDSILPATTAIKRRRLEQAEEAKRLGKPVSTSFLEAQPKPELPKAKKPKKEINIKDVVRERREAEEEAARQDEENLREVLQGMSVEEMKSLAIVEEMELPDRSDRPLRREVNGEDGGRWDPRWNGRRNFKKFRRQGETDNALRGHRHRVMVPLEEVKKKDFGIGEEYWLDSNPSKKSRRDKDGKTQSQSQAYSSARSQQTMDVPAELATNGAEHEAIDVDAPRTTRHMEAAQQAEESAPRFQSANAKRPAPGRAREPPSKKQKTLVEDEESDSEDELKFRVRKRR